MELVKSKKANVNYLAQIVEIKDFKPHTDPEVIRLKVAFVQGYSIIVGIDEKPGKFIYFPAMSQINPKFLSYCNLYRHAELNMNPEKTGMFEDNGRVKAIRLRGQLSEGFLLPLEMLDAFVKDSFNVSMDLDSIANGTEFDTVEHAGKSFWLNKKYIVIDRNYQGQSQHNSNRRNKKIKRFNRVDENQFRFHYDTVLLRKDPTVLSPDNLISITSKWHGTSAIFAYVKGYHKLSFKEKIAKWLTGHEFENYEYFYSSRSVIKNQYADEIKRGGYYGCDVWGEAFEYIKPYLIKGMTIYAEICGFLPNGNYVQKNYDYGCVPPSGDEKYEYGKHYKIMVYRVTMTNDDGIVHEFSANEVQQWCENKGLMPVKEMYYGYAGELYNELDVKDSEWSSKFMECLANDKKRFYMEKNSPDCTNKVPHEGIVIKKEDSISHAWKLKSFAFINGEQAELDKGEGNIEDDN